MMAACSSEDAALNNSPQQGRKVHFTATIAAPGGNAGTRTEYTEVTTGSAAGTINVVWKAGDEIALIHNGTKDEVKVETVNTDGSATITGDITVGTNGEAVEVCYPAAAWEWYAEKSCAIRNETFVTNITTKQDGTLKYIQDNLDTRMGKGTLKVDGDKATLSDNVTLASQIAIWKLALQDDAETPAALSATQVSVKVGGETPVTIASTAKLSTATSSVYLAMDAITNENLIIEATVEEDTYSYTNEDVSLALGQYYQSTVKMSLPKIVDLSTVTEGITIKDGFTVEGTLGKNVKISIADGATVTLDNVSINADGTWNRDNWAGLTCEGDATIILKDGTTNTVKGFYSNYPGILAAVGHTLIIKGTGSLTASSNGGGAGIGGGWGAIACGNNEIQGGTITATGGYNAAGIGSGNNSNCGNITISGGTVEATGGTDADHQEGGAGIGSGYAGTCGAITISGGSVTATGGGQGAGIGSGKQGTCTTITISGGTVSATGGQWAAGIGSGNEGTCGAITISGGTITATGGYCAAGIGSGSSGNCDNITISGGTVSATGGQYAAGIGSGVGDILSSTDKCGDIIISGGTVEATGGQWAAGIGSCNDSTCGDITITTGVTQVTATKGDGATNSIGAGSNGSCGTVTIDPSLNQATSTKVNADDTLTLTPAQ